LTSQSSFHLELAFLTMSWEPSYLTFFPRYLQFALLIEVLELIKILLPRVYDGIMGTCGLPTT